jgi:prepilin-type N-terminal cleavage/methylation domain-containing protein
MTGRGRAPAPVEGKRPASGRGLRSGDESRGFTLVELLIVVVLAGFLGATVVNLFRTQNVIFRSENQSLEMDQNLRAGLDLMLRELRNTGIRDRLLPYADPPGIALADSNQIRFKQDFHSTTNPTGTSDGDVLDGNEDIEYTFTPADSTVRRRTRGTAGDSGAQPMAEHVTRLRLTYFDPAGALIPFPLDAAAMASVRRIHVRLEGAAADGRSVSTLESDVVPRNLAY